MKALVILLALIPLSGFANDVRTPQSPSVFQNDCKNATNSAEKKKNCLIEEKQKEAQQNFRDFQENNHMEKTL